MKLTFAKKNKAGPAPRRGFALLFSVLISSLLLTIGLSILSIALKELAISTAVRQSIHAFYAADSGLEYALYHDTKFNDILPIDFNNSIAQNLATTSSKIFVISDSGRTDDANYDLYMTKTKPAGVNMPATTTITSYGHDSTGDDRVERAIEQTY